MHKKKRMERECGEQGCNIDYFFKGNSTFVAIDVESRKMGLLFILNPFKTYIVSLDEVSDAKTSNGASGLSLGGTREVFFTFMLRGKKYKVRTLYASTTLSVKSRQVMEAVAKADRLVEVFNA